MATMLSINNMQYYQFFKWW